MEEYIYGNFKGLFDDYSGFIFVSITTFYVIGAWYVAYRSGTFNFVINRLWRIYSGGGDFNNEKMNSAWQEVIDVETFRFKTGLNINSKKKVRI